MQDSEKLQHALNILGPRWVLHQDRRVKKGNYEPAVQRVDVEKTFKEYLKRVEKEKQ